LPGDQDSLAAALTRLGNNLCRQSRPAEAEPFLREALGIWDKLNAKGDWPGYAGNVLGRTLLDQKRYADAEPVLLASHKNVLLINDAKRTKEAVTLLVQLYTGWEKPDQAAEWQRILAALDQSQKP